MSAVPLAVILLCHLGVVVNHISADKLADNRTHKDV
jgi:hypothetical protein